MRKLSLIIIFVILFFSCKRDNSTKEEAVPFQVADYPIELDGAWIPIAERIGGEWVYKEYGCYYELQKPDPYVGLFVYFDTHSNPYNSISNGTIKKKDFGKDNVYEISYINTTPSGQILDSTQIWYLISLENNMMRIGQTMKNKKNEYLYKCFYNIPYIYTDTTIDVTSAIYHNLEFIGGWGYIPSGYKGIFIYHLSEKEFIALERCCTYDPGILEARVYYDEKTGVLRDPICGSEFQPFFAGGVTKGPAELPLRQYKTQYYESGDLKRLRIYN